jgi:hypothetical protein
MTVLAGVVASSIILSFAQQDQPRSGWEYIGQIWEQGRGAEQRNFAGFHDQKQDCINQINSVETQAREAAGSTALQYSFVCMNRTSSREQNVVGFREIRPGRVASNAASVVSIPGNRPEFQPRRFARWTVSVEEGDSVRRCDMALRGDQYALVTFIQQPDGRGSLSMHAAIAQPMSNLRAGTLDYNLNGIFRFDGDVILTASGLRAGRNGILTPSNEVRFLEYLEAANSVTLSFEYERIATVNLSGSAAAVTALRECIANL